MNTVIGARIVVEDPSRDVVAWAKENLEFPNPEYEKKERMGFWLGRTPKILRLYEWDGNKLILPFGMCRELMPLLCGTLVFTDFRQDSVIKYGGVPVPLYDYQEEAVRKMVEAKFGILQSTTGSGKTQMGIELIKRFRRRALWLCHTADLLNQSRDRALQYMDSNLIGTITEGKVNVGIGVTFATVQTMANLELTRYRDYWDVVIVDECFPGNTEVITDSGYKQICNITEQDKVLTISKNNGLEYRSVRTLFKKTPQSMVRILLENGTELYCTGNHPILTMEGYKRADEITNDDAVCCVRKRDGYLRTETGNEIQHHTWKKKGFLLGRMQKISRKRLDRRTQRKVKTADDQTEQGNVFQTNEGKESDAKPGDQGSHVGYIAQYRAQAKGPWWKRKRANGTSDCADERNKEFYSSSRVCCSDKDSERARISNELQAGHCDTGTEPRNRSGWKFSLLSGKAKARPEERFVLCFNRVDSIEIQERTGDGTYGGLCPDGYVYNLEVAGNHNYFANGVNVHNCHRISSSAASFTRYEKVLNHLAARHKIGLTATPQRSDGLIKATFALIGKVAWEVPESAVADKVMGVRIRTVDTGTEITEECLNEDGTINYVKLIEHLTTDAERNKLIARKIMEEKNHSCLILSDRLAQLEEIRSLLPYEMQEKSAFINGRMQSKKAKAEREQAIEDMRTGEKKYLFASYGLAKEGLDIPRLDRLFLASPAKYSAIITQAVGRVRRTFAGKETPVVYDFRDEEIGFCDRAYKERCRSYRKMGAEIERGFLR